MVAIWPGLEHGEQDRLRSACSTHGSLEPMALPRTHRRHERTETMMAGKNKGGREAKKPKQDQNKKQKGQTPPTRSVLDALQGRADKKER